MAEFLDTTGVSYRLQQIINNSREKLILISPYLKMNERIKQSLEDQNRLKTDVRLVYGKNDLQPAELNWLKSLREVKSYYCRNLHAKCYLNEKEAIVTSMNLYDFSQVNNLEMGIYVDKTSDADLYHKIYDEAMRMVRMSDEIQITVAQIPEDRRQTSEVINALWVLHRLSHRDKAGSQVALLQRLLQDMEEVRRQ